MRTYRAKSGPFTEQYYYTPREVEQICSDELQKLNLLPSEPRPIRIDSFIEKRFKVTPEYEKLDERFLGFTEFGTEGVKRIVISRMLSDEEDEVSERRVNSTLAHETGHGLLHAYLFVIEQHPHLNYGQGLEPNKILCRKETIQGLKTYRQTGYNGCWWEYQANLAIGSLLLPKLLFMRSLQPFLTEEGIMGNCRIEQSRKEEASRALSQIFNVNPIVVKIRIEALLQNSENKQLTF